MHYESEDPQKALGRCKTAWRPAALTASVHVTPQNMQMHLLQLILSAALLLASVGTSLVPAGPQLHQTYVAARLHVRILTKAFIAVLQISVS